MHVHPLVPSIYTIIYEAIKMILHTIVNGIYRFSIIWGIFCIHFMLSVMFHKSNDNICEENEDINIGYHSKRTLVSSGKWGMEMNV